MVKPGLMAIGMIIVAFAPPNSHPCLASTGHWPDELL